MDNCERCCFFEHCTKTGRIEKDCVYGNKRRKEDEDGIEREDETHA